MCSYSRVPYISKCCCVINLRTSAFLIGFLQTLFGLAFIVFALANHFITEKHIEDHDVHSADHDHSLIFYTIGGAFILLGVILILGVVIKNFMLIKVYIVLAIIDLLVGFIIYLIILINLFLAFVIASADTSNFVGEIIKIFAISTAQVLVVVIVIAFAVITLKAYFLLCVNSYLKELIKVESGTPQAVGYTAIAETDDNNVKV